MSPESETKKPAESAAEKENKYVGFSAEERAAMKQRLKEEKSAATKDEDEKAQLAMIAGMDAADRAMAERIQAIVLAAAPELVSKLWYGMPAYYKGDKNICFFQPAKKFKTRYSTLGFNDPAHLDDGGMWPVAYALKEMTPAVEAKIAALVKKAVS